MKPSEQTTPVTPSTGREIPPAYYVVTRKLGEAMKGSRTAIKTCKRGSCFGVFNTQGSAENYRVERKLMLCAVVIAQ